VPPQAPDDKPEYVPQAGRQPQVLDGMAVLEQDIVVVG